jgi:hypothetical protein
MSIGKERKNYKSKQQHFSTLFFDFMAAFVAASNTSNTPSFFLAEHSKNPIAPIFFARFSPCSFSISCLFKCLNFFNVSISWRKSFLFALNLIHILLFYKYIIYIKLIYLPTKIIGVVGKCSLNSSYHFKAIFINESMSSML